MYIPLNPTFMVKYITLLGCIIFLSIHISYAQVFDDFSDGEFLINPTWVGDTGRFQVIDNVLRSNGESATSIIYLSTPNAKINNVEWRVNIQIDGNPSGSNFARYYLMSDQQDLSGPLNGYFIQIGEGGSADGIDLFRQTGEDIEQLIDGPEGTVAISPNIRLKVTRDESGQWEVSADLSGGENFVVQGEITDDSISSASHLGVWVSHTSSRREDFSFDNIFVGDPVRDTLPPELTELQIVNDNQIDLTFSESLEATGARDASSYSLDNGLGNPTTVVFGIGDSNSVSLFWATSFENNVTYQLSISNLSDLEGNVLDTPIIRNFLFFIPDDPVEGNVIFSEIFPDPTPAVGLPEEEFIELWNVSNGTFNLADWMLEVGNNEFTLPPFVLSPDSYVIITSPADTGAFSGFGSVIGTNQNFTLPNTGATLRLIASDSTLLDTVAYEDRWYQDPERADGGFSLELIDPQNEACPPIANWRAANNGQGGTPGGPNSVADLPSDTIPPLLESIAILAPDSIEVCFNESMDAVSLSNPENFVLENIGPAISAFPQAPDFECVVISLPVTLDTGQVFTFIIDGVSDCSGNEIMGTIRDTIIQGRVPIIGEIIITEIFPDPTPVVGLPEAEYVEIYNTTGEALDISNWGIADESGVANWGEFTLFPFEYVTIVDDLEAEAFLPFGRLLRVEDLPSLGNAQDSLTLQNSEGTPIDIVAYTDEWYQDPERSGGGFSLERIDTAATACAPIENWRASVSLFGGTPGSENSVIDLAVDSIAPEIVSITILSPSEVELTFNESMDETLLEQVDRYEIESIGAVLAAEVIFPDVRGVRLTLPETLDTGEVFVLIISGLADCKGNLIEEAIRETLVVGSQPQAFDVVFNEIFPDPSPSVGLPEAEFIELFNRSDRIFDVEGLELTDGSGSVFLPNVTINPGDAVIIIDEDNLPLFNDVLNVITVPNLISLGNAQDSLWLLNGNGEILDFLFYDDTWYQDDERDGGGYTLERISPDFVNCNLRDNWGASLDPTGGTPGQTNSINGVFVDNTAPFIENLDILNSNTIQITFIEQMEPATLENTRNYTIDQGIGEPVIVTISQPALRTIRLEFAAELVDGIIYTLTLSNLSDCSGNVLNESRQIGIPDIPEAGDILLNEILFNPFPQGSDFLEIINVSDKVLDLSLLEIGEVEAGDDTISNTRPITEELNLLLPGEIVCLTTDVAFQIQRYQPPASANLLEVERLPSFPDSEGSAAVAFNGLILDQFFYEDDFHFPTLLDDEGVSLERISTQIRTQDPSNWHSAAATVNFATPGYPNSQGLEIGDIEDEVSLEKEVFTPNGDGDNDVLAINYSFNFTGVNARIRIYDENGRLIRLLQNNILLGPQPGTFFWDGRNDENQKALTGIYVILFEITNQNTGDREVFKEVAVLADTF